MRPFSNGSESSAWCAANCEQCAKGWRESRDWTNELLRCELEQALLVAYWDDGEVTEEVARRIDRPGGTRCREFVPEDSAAPPAGRDSGDSQDAGEEVRG